MIDRDLIMIVALPWIKGVQAITSMNYMKKNIGDQANYLYCQLFTELNSCACAVITILDSILENYLKHKKHEKALGQGKKMSLDEQLANLK